LITVGNRNGNKTISRIMLPRVRLVILRIFRKILLMDNFINV
jgi:hypothetical protein